MSIRYTINNMQSIAREHGGKCLSKEYIDLYSPLKWICNKGHTWDADYAIVRQGGWCVQCIKDEKKRLRLEEIKGKALLRGGKCLSDTYKDATTKLKFQCFKGHVWMTAPSIIKHGSWCPKCAGKAMPTIKELHQLAESKQGKFLSKKYINSRLPLKWQCKNGHVWFAAYNNVKNNETWCPFCYGNIPKSIDDIQLLAKSKGGTCLSKTYINNRGILIWQCDKGHQWKATTHQISLRSWCPYCAGKGTRTIKDMQRLAQARNGKCLSTKYISSKAKLKWQCDKKHIWNTTPGNIVSGCWCPICAKQKRLETRKQNRILKISE